MTGHAPEGKDATMRHVPTLLMVLRPTPAGMQGTDLQPLLHHANTKGRADRYCQDVYSPEPGRGPIPKREGVRTERGRYIWYTDPHPPLEQLFGLAADMQEEKDLAPDPTHAKTLNTRRDRCNAYRQGEDHSSRGFL
jgi:hypothetical protein